MSCPMPDLDTGAARALTERALASVRPPAVAPREGLGWFVVYTQIKCEVRARMGIEAKGIRSYLPMTSKTRKYRNITETIKRPVFTRYLFVQFDPAAPGWRDAIESVDGVDELLSNDMKPMRVPAAVIEAVQRAEANGVFDMTRKCAFKIGEKVRIAEGPFMGFIGRVRSASANKRAGILLEFMGRFSPVEIPLGDLEKIT